MSDLETAIGWAIHNLTTSITHKLATPTSLDDDCAVLGRAVVAQVWVEVDPEHNPGWVMGPGDEVPWQMRKGSAVLEAIQAASYELRNDEMSDLDHEHLNARYRAFARRVRAALAGKESA